MSLFARGPQKSPILIVGDSLPESKVTRDRLVEILDRRGVTYNSIIIPLKYYINEYLIGKYSLKLPYDFNNREDIFRFVNAIDEPEQKSGLQGNSDLLDGLRSEILNERAEKPVIILCMGDFAFFAVRAVLNKYNSFEKKSYPKSGTKYTLEKLGAYFDKNVDIKDKENPYILPILHNSSNLHFHNSEKFIPQNKRRKYIYYMQYIAEELCEIMVNNTRLKNYLCQI